MAHREALAQVGGLDERFFMYGEDLDSCKRFDDAGWESAYYTGAEVIHYVGRSSASAPLRFYLEMQKANRQYYLKHHGAAAAVAPAVIVCIHQALRLALVAGLFLLHRPGHNTYRHKMMESLACLQWLARLCMGGQASGGRRA
jgi:GT2 family glycosyltransferase